MLYLRLSYQKLTLIYWLNANIIASCTFVATLGINVCANLKNGSHCAIIAAEVDT